MNAYLQRIRLLFFLPVFLLLLLVLVVEEDRTELSQMALVVGAGLDQGQGEDERWSLTVELAYKDQNDSPGEQRSFTVQGNTWEELQETLGNRLDKDAYWASAVTFLLNPTVLEQDAGSQLLRSIYLDPQINASLLLAVSEEEIAELFRASYGESTYLSAGLEQGLRLQADEEGRGAVSLADYLERVQLLGGALTLPVVSLADETGDEEQAQAIIAEERYLAGR